jgi:hypothetical protein
MEVSTTDETAVLYGKMKHFICVEEQEFYFV